MDKNMFCFQCEQEMLVSVEKRQIQQNYRMN